MKLYHVSQDPTLKALIPRVPNNYFVRNGFENGKIKRVSFCQTIGGCLRGLSMNVTGKRFYVYSPVSIDPSAVMFPDTTQVPDAATTHEVWYLKPVSVKLVYIIEAGKMVAPKRFTYGSNEAENYTARYKFIKGKKR